MPSQQYISRQYAIEHNLPRYFTGEPCIHGHIDERYVINKRCLECSRRSELQKEKRRGKAGILRDEQNKLRKEAIENNLPRYFTGEPCKNEHIAERYTKGNDCVECVRLRSQQRIDKQKASVKETGIDRYFTGEPCAKGHIAERYVVKNRCVECVRIKSRIQKQNQKEKRKKLLGANGQTTYSTGKPCIHGHNAERFIVNNMCVECKRIQREKARRKAGMLSRDERNKLRKEAADKKKKDKQQKFQESKLNKKEKEIVVYARKCLQIVSENTRYTKLLPTNIAILENGYDTNQLNIHLSQYSNSWRNKQSKRKWHIDHIIPLSKLVKMGVTEVYILNSLDNLQLLSPSQNLKKGAKFVHTKEEVNEFISRKLGNNKSLGFYYPSERIKKLVNIEAERIYQNVTSSISGTELSIKSSKIIALRAIKYDMWAGYNFFSQKNIFDTYDISTEFYNEGRNPHSEGLLYLLYEEHLEKQNKKGFFKKLFE